jgi:hypothetical protein
MKKPKKDTVIPVWKGEIQEKRKTQTLVWELVG